jgi:1-aminocyclopropane-1-carboxylate deaminase/D-cysteine desulfhydrase-like pyridoxal-dependent ACC family enzyme
VTILSDRWRGFRNIPHVALADLPTPVEPIESLTERAGAKIWIKRDDLTSPRYGGNKVRKLEYVLGEALAQRADTLITAGAAGSHHALATTIFAEDIGFPVHAVTMPQRATTHVEENLRALLALGAEVHPVGSAPAMIAKMATLSARLRLRGRHPFTIPPGGSSVAGVIGHVEAGLELARQMEAGVAPEPDALFVPFGTGGTLAGLAIGFAAAGITTRLIGVRVVPRVIARKARVGAMIKATVRHLRSLDERFPDVAETARAHVEIDHEEFGEGYGASTSAGRNAERIAKEHLGLTLEPTYTAKALAAMLRRARDDLGDKNILYVHTLSSFDPGPMVQGAPPLPASLRKLLVR